MMLSCPTPLNPASKILLGHGSGGKLTHDLVRRFFYPAFDNPLLRSANDGAVLDHDKTGQWVCSTDAHVVAPLFFPGGDIGRLAVCGSVNDVCMMGAVPRYLAASFILEEGLDLAILERVLQSMREAAKEAGVEVVAGDTKVVQKGKADGLYITTTALGVRSTGSGPSGDLAQPGDQVILSGSIGDHGIAVLSARGELGFEAEVQSDVAPLNHLVTAMSIARDSIHVLRDPTRGGLATTLNEIARQSEKNIVINESRIPVRGPVVAACEMLGYDPLYVANEGKLVALVAPESAEKVLEAMQATRYGEEAVIIGEVSAAPKGRVLMKTLTGSHRVLDMLAGELLPRIC
jgi:hydrogenase expression/formation protein HypE